VRSRPNGPVIGALHNQSSVTTWETIVDARGQRWSRVDPVYDGKSGWVFRQYLICGTRRDGTPTRPTTDAWKECILADHAPERSIVGCSRVLARPSRSAHAAAFHNRGLAFAARGNLDQAVSDISAGIRLDPLRAYRWQERGELYTRQGRYQQAIGDITEAIRIDPIPRAFRFHSRAKAYRGLGDLTRAIADFTEAIRLDPVARSFRFADRGNALRDVGQYHRALADYETALKLAPTDAWVFVERGRTYTRMGHSQAAQSNFATALLLDPSNEELRRIIGLELAVNTPSTVSPTPAIPPRTPPPPTQATPAPQGAEISSGFIFTGNQAINARNEK
jgi:tetratricopeptide (TPR) repeat protein